ncbi:MAG: hypothetical protein LC753_09580 [Acidobacteria bacterium]|nr:hypothetical protein [Acidobacteriota bacterium]
MPVPRRPEILISAQNEWYTQPTSCGARAGVDTVITISGHVFLGIGAPKTDDLPAFLVKTQPEVEARIEHFLERNRDVSSQTAGIVIMDIEKPHPSNFHCRPDIQDDLVRAFRIRAAAARAKFPKAKLAFYGTLVPDSRGRADNAVYTARKEALVCAGRMCMFDEVDYLIPVAYPRFGPDDAYWDTYKVYTRLAITGSRELLRSDGSSLPVLPLLTYVVANKNSNNNRQLLMDLLVPHNNPLHETLRVQLRVLAAEQVRTAVFWVGRNSDLITLVPNPNSRTVTQHLCGR